jgi:hypothetical protein
MEDESYALADESGESYAYAFLIGGFTLLFAWWKYTEWQEDKAYEKRSSVPFLSILFCSLLLD